MPAKKISAKKKLSVKKRDLLDIMESYKYLNSMYGQKLPHDGRWDYARGWIELNLNTVEWRPVTDLVFRDFF
ncbi:MAG: hypothetical protein K8R21_01540 [Leptospira sp.]|nr:hypothetical protein [Leptospira sp.]